MNCEFRDALESGASDELIATALNGVVYAENGRLHIKSNGAHYVYKPDGSPAGWYRRNLKNLDDIYLGAGACPCEDLENLEVKDEARWVDLLATKDKTESEFMKKAKEAANVRSGGTAE